MKTYKIQIIFLFYMGYDDEEQEDLEERTSSSSSSSSSGSGNSINPILPFLPMWAAIMMMFTVTSINSNRSSYRSSYDDDEDKVHVHPTFSQEIDESNMTHAEKLKKISLSQNYASARDDDFYIHVEPRVAGQTAEITVWQQGGLKGLVEKIRLYEDGKEIATSKHGMLTHTVTHTNAGEHSYNAYITTDRDSAATYRIEVDFSGERIDFKPYFQSWSTSGEKAGKAATVHVQGKDIGDDNGIERIVLFEDGKQIAEFTDETWHHHTVKADSPQSHTYHAEAYDKTGNKIVSGKERIDFLGDALPPEISWFSTSGKEAGKTAIFSISADDDDNHDENAGIESIALYEDGNVIHRRVGESLTHTVVHDNAGDHTYHAVARNKNGKTAKSDSETIHFIGEAMPPEINWFSGPYSKKAGRTAAFSVSADDDNNYGDNTGVAMIRLYEDGKVIASKEDDWTTFVVEHTDSGKHTYQAEIINTAGKSTFSEKTSVRFSGEHIAPDVGWWSAHYYDDEKIARFSVDGKDTYNHGDSAGIARMVLFENGVPIKTEEDDDSLVAVLERAPGRYKYHVVITNKGGKTTKTETKTIAYK